MRRCPAALTGPAAPGRRRDNKQMIYKHAKRLITMVLAAAVAAMPLSGCGAAQVSSMTLFLIRQELIKKPKDISLISVRKMSLTTTNSM